MTVRLAVGGAALAAIIVAAIAAWSSWQDDSDDALPAALRNFDEDDRLIIDDSVFADYGTPHPESVAELISEDPAQSERELLVSVDRADDDGGIDWHYLALPLAAVAALMAFAVLLRYRRRNG